MLQVTGAQSHQHHIRQLSGQAFEGSRVTVLCDGLLLHGHTQLVLDRSRQCLPPSSPVTQSMEAIAPGICGYGKAPHNLSEQLRKALRSELFLRVRAKGLGGPRKHPHWVPQMRSDAPGHACETIPRKERASHV